MQNYSVEMIVGEVRKTYDRSRVGGLEVEADVRSLVREVIGGEGAANLVIEGSLRFLGDVNLMPGQRIEAVFTVIDD